MKTTLLERRVFADELDMVRPGFVYLTLLLTALIMSGCGKIDLTINKHDILAPIIGLLSVPTAAEVVSGSTSDALTPTNQYHVNITVGTMIKSVQQTTTNGYKISYGLDGELVPVQ